jgi:hypothetical protein
LIVRSLAGILLRRSIDKIPSTTPADTLNNIRSSLLQIWSVEDNRLLLKRLSHAIAQSAANGTWSDLLPSMINQAPSFQPTSLISLLNLIEIISEYCSEDISKNLPVIGTFLSTFLNSPDPNVQVACAKASGACIISLEDDNQRNLFKVRFLFF